MRICIDRRGVIPYEDGLTLQKQLHAEVVAGTREDTLLLCSHQPVLTLGTSTQEAHLLTNRAELAIPIYEVGRGGSITYHGPEQLLVYPIVNLKHHRTDVGWYMRSLEEIVIRTLATFGVVGIRVPDKTGVWIRGDAKIAFIGVKISRWCTFHGVSLNIKRCAEKFSLINPCGLGDIQVTSIQEESGTVPSFDSVADCFSGQFVSFFGYTPHS